MGALKEGFPTTEVTKGHENRWDREWVLVATGFRQGYLTLETSGNGTGVFRKAVK